MNGRKAFVVGLAVLLQAAVVTAQTPPVLVGRTPEGVSVGPLAVTKVSVETVIAGFLAQTTMTLTFRNERDEVLEGELVFPLPEGATVSGFALDVEGTLVDGVVVGKHEARIALEVESRRRIDPGLVEWVRGSTYRTRVYPVPEQGERTVRLRYVEDLGAQRRGAREALYRLPLSFGQSVAELNVRIETSGPTSPRLVSSVVPGLELRSEDGRFVASAGLRNQKPAGDIVLAVPVATAGRALVERSEGSDSFFVIEDFPAAPAPARVQPRPRRVLLLLDASYSSSGEARGRELRLLGQWATRATGAVVDVVAFRDVVDKARTFTIGPGDATPILAYLRGQPLDGGTRLGALPFHRNPGGYGVAAGPAGPPPDYDYALLVSDGLSTLGPETVPASPIPVYALSASRQANHVWLRQLADQSGGRYLNLRDVTDDVALAAIGAPAFSFLAFESDPSQVGDVLPGSRRGVDGRFLVSGRLQVPEASVRIRYGYPDGSAPVVRSFTLRRSEAVEGRLVGRLWAQQKVAELSSAPERNRAELLGLGRRFQIVTPGASLLVLETVEQYAFYGVEPPRSRAELYERFFELRDEFEREKAEAVEEKRARVQRDWQERLDWWKREFRLNDSLQSGGPDDVRPDGSPTVFTAAGIAAGATVGFGANTEAEESERPSGQAVIRLKPWDPRAPYLDVLKQAGSSGAYAAYLAQRSSYAASPAFFLDCADFFFKNKWPGLARRSLTNLLELRLDDARLTRIAAQRLVQAREWSLAVDLYEKVLALRPEEPQSHRDLALALEARADAQRTPDGMANGTAADYVRALDLLDTVVQELWDDRFDGIEVVALTEANRILGVLERAGRPEARTAPPEPRYRSLLEADVRVVLSWDTDATDMDLQVVEPTGEQCDFSHDRTRSGGAISDDLTGGYGPEEYVVRRALPGPYTVKAHYFGSAAGRLAGPATVQAMLITDFGRPSEQRKTMTLRLSPGKQGTRFLFKGADDEDEDEGEATVVVGSVEYQTPAQALRSADPSRRRMAASVLGREKDQAKAVTSLRASLHDTSSLVRCEAAAALWQISGCPHCPEAEDLERQLRAELLSAGPDERLFAARVLDGWGRASLPELARMLGDSDAQVARFAAEALGRQGERAAEAAPALAALLEDGIDPGLARLAGLALARIGPAALPAVRPLLRQRGPEVRLRGVQVLQRMGGREAEAELDAIADDPDEDPAVRRQALSATRRLERARAIRESGPLLDPQTWGNISHVPVGCLVEGEFPLLEARIEPAATIARSRLYFKSALSPQYYYAEMGLAGGGYFATRLPKPRTEGSPITYYIFAITSEGDESQTPEFEARVVADAADCPAGQRVAPPAPPR